MWGTRATRGHRCTDPLPAGYHCPMWKNYWLSLSTAKLQKKLSVISHLQVFSCLKLLFTSNGRNIAYSRPMCKCVAVTPTVIASTLLSTAPPQSSYSPNNCKVKSSTYPHSQNTTNHSHFKVFDKGLFQYDTLQNNFLCPFLAPCKPSPFVTA